MVRPDIELLKEKVLLCRKGKFQKDEFLETDLTEYFVKRLLEEGKCQMGNDAIMKFMENNRCHWNTVKYSIEHPKYQVCSGLAYSSDKIWRSHTWLEKDSLIYETTSPRLKYFGICGDPDNIGLGGVYEDCLIEYERVERRRISKQRR